MVMELTERQVHRVGLLSDILGCKINLEQFQMKQEDPFTLYEASLNKDLDSMDIETKKKDIMDFEAKIKESMDVLSPVKRYFDDFEANIDQVTSQMESMQIRLNELNQILNEKKETDALLTTELKKVLIQSNTVKYLLENEIDIEWVGKLRELETKSQLLVTYKGSGSTSISEEMVQLLDDVILNVENKCMEKIRAFMMVKIKSLRLVESDPQDIQKELLPMSPMITLLKKRAPELANEFKTAYIYTIRWKYYYHTVKYTSLLETAKLNETLDSSINFETNSMNEYLINLPGRIDQLGEDPVPISEQMLETDINMKFNTEQLIQSLNSRMMTYFLDETMFLLSFFQLTNEELNQALKLEFAPIFKVGSGFTSWVLSDTNYDYFAMLLVIRRFQKMDYQAQQERMPELMGTYINGQLLLIWPKFQKTIDTLCQNMTASFGSSRLIREVVQSKTLLIPLKLTQTISTIVAHLIKLSQNLVFEIETTEPLTSSIQRLSITLERGVVQLSKRLSEDKQKLFLYVNFQLVVNVLDGEIDRESKDSEDERKIGTSILAHYQQLVEVYK